MTVTNVPLVEVTGPSTLARARFGPGMLLQHEDLEQLNAYTQALNRLMFSSLFGCGVVCGLVVSAQADGTRVTVTVAAGLALDSNGDPIQVPCTQRLVFDEACHPDIAKLPLWVVLCGASRCCAPRTALCGSDEDEAATVCTRERAYFKLRIDSGSDRPPCVCGGATTLLDEAGQAARDNQCAVADPACASCDCVLLARIDPIVDQAGQRKWPVDHRVRRFVRPVLMRDPQVWIEDQARKQGGTGQQAASRDTGQAVSSTATNLKRARRPNPG
jgi:hypothetical protein